MAKIAEELKPKVDEISTKVTSLTTTVEGIAHKVEELAESLRENVDSVGGKTKGILNSAESIAQTASRQFERFSPYMVGALTGIRLIKSLYELNRGKNPAEATTRKAIEKTPVKGKRRR